MPGKRGNIMTSISLLSIAVCICLSTSVTAVGLEPKYIRSEAVKDAASLIDKEDAAIVSADGDVKHQPAAEKSNATEKKVVKLGPPKIGLVSWFRNEDASLSWKSKIGGFVSNCSEDAALAKQSQGGFNVLQKVLTGSPSTRCSFGHVVPEVFTICSATRYTSKENQNRILQGEPGVWFHGHYQGKTHIANYGDHWLTKLQSSHDADNILVPGGGVQDSKQWVVLCGTNSHAKDGSRLIRGLDDGLEGKQVKSFFTKMFSHKGAVGGGVRLNIGDFKPAVASNSDWALFELLTWDRVLEPDEMDTAIRYIKTKLERPMKEEKKDPNAGKFTGLYRYGKVRKNAIRYK